MRDQIKVKRRQLLQGMGLGMAAYAAPVLLGIGVARASGQSGNSGASDARGSAPSAPSRPEPAAPTELVLLSPQPADAVLAAAGYRVLQRQDLGRGTLYRLGRPAGKTQAQAQADLRSLLPDAVSDVNTLYRPDDFLCETGSCTAHSAISWPQSAGTADLRIGMIDTGINTAHEAFQGQRLRVFQADLGERPAAGRQHGTAVAALLIGRPDSRTPGLLPGAELIAVEAFHRDRRGEAADAFSLTSAISRLVAEEVRVINLSFSGPANLVLQSALAEAAAAQIALVAAAGNDGPGAPAAYPAAWPGVIAVTAVDRQDQPYRQANRGDYIRFAAPGVNVWTAASISGGRLKSGTSYAAPFVTAAIAIRLAASPGLPLSDHLSDLTRCARDLGDPGVDPIFGSGIISMEKQCLGG